MPDSAENPIAAATPESGTGTTTSASTGDSMREQAAQILARLHDGPAEDDRIRAREINMLEDALREGLLGRPALAGEAFGADA